MFIVPRSWPASICGTRRSGHSLPKPHCQDTIRRFFLGLPQTCVCGMPAEFQGQFCAVDRIAEIVSGAIRHECSKICVWAFARGAHRVEHVTDAVNDLKVGALGVAADVISLSHPARFKHALNSGTMILYMEPVTDVGAGSIYGERLAGQCIERNQRNKFFRKLARAIVIRTIGDERGKAVGFVESPDKMVTGSF